MLFNVDGHTNLDNVSIAGIVTAANLSIPANGDIRVANGTWSGEVAGKIQQNSNKLYIQGGSSGWQFRSSGGTGRWEIDGSGHITPVADSTYDIGTNSVRVRNFYADTYYGDGSNLTGISGVTINGNVDNRLVTATGTTGTLNGESNLTWDGTNLKVGNNATLSNYNSGADNLVLGDHSNHSGMTILSSPSHSGFIMFSDNNGGGAQAYRGQIEYHHGSGATADHMRFLTDSSEKLRISSKGQLKLDGSAINNSTNMYHGTESGGGDSNSIYIHRGNSTFDWQGGLIMRGTGSTWGLRISGSGAFTTNSDTAGEIFGVHPTEPTNPTNAQSTRSNDVDDAYFRVMANAKIFATVPIYQSGSRPFYLNSTAVTSNETITPSYNAMSVGNITINSGNSVTVQSGARWVIV